LLSALSVFYLFQSEKVKTKIEKFYFCQMWWKINWDRRRKIKTELD